ncbi:MAG: hypothetical protein ACI85S_002644, partial [Pseudohongiellaceae bacterium]
FKITKVRGAHFLSKRVKRAEFYEIDYLHLKFRETDFILV